MKIGHTAGMRPPLEITRVGFKPPRDTRLAVEAMSIEELRSRAPAEHFEKLQRADFFRLVGVLKGYTSPMVDFSTYPMQPGDWVLVRPGQVFRYDFSRPWVGWLLVFRPDSLSTAKRSQTADEFDLPSRVEDLACQFSLDEEKHDWMNRSLHQLQLDGALAADLFLRNKLLRLQLAGTLLRLSMWQLTNPATGAYSAAGQAHYRRFRKQLEADFSSRHQVQHYASALSMSERNLSRVCMAAAGVPAKAVINQRLMLEAKRLLAYTAMPVQDIGRELGFEEATNFVKFFRKDAGMTPLSFRREV